jgi:hypothetical protein
VIRIALRMRLAAVALSKALGGGWEADEGEAGALAAAHGAR